MKRTWLIFTAVITLYVSNAIASVQTDYDHSIDFGQYHTYSWGQVQTKDSLWADRIREDVDRQLQAKGWKLVTLGTDVVVLGLGDSHNQQEEQTFYSGGGWRWGGMGGVATTSTYTTRQGILVVSMFDTKNKKLAWRGTATGGLSNNPDKNIGKLNKAVAKMLKDFPPKTNERK